MAKAAAGPVQDDPREAALAGALAGFFDAEWYQARYPDIVGSDLQPLQHLMARSQPVFRWRLVC
jgi:hypothetical protein